MPKNIKARVEDRDGPIARIDPGGKSRGRFAFGECDRSVIDRQPVEGGAMAGGESFQPVERAVFLEGTLRNNLSPQMSAALSFSTSLSNQGIQ